MGMDVYVIAVTSYINNQVVSMRVERCIYQSI